MSPKRGRFLVSPSRPSPAIALWRPTSLDLLAHTEHSGTVRTAQANLLTIQLTDCFKRKNCIELEMGNVAEKGSVLSIAQSTLASHSPLAAYLSGLAGAHRALGYCEDSAGKPADH